MQFVYPITNPTPEAHVIRIGGGGLIAVEPGELVQVNFTREVEGNPTGYQPAANLPDGVLLSTHFTFDTNTCPEFFVRFRTQVPQPSLPLGWRFGVAVVDADTTVTIGDFSQSLSATLPYQIVTQGAELYEYSRLAALPKLLTTSVNDGYFVRFMMPDDRLNLQAGRNYRLYFFAVGEWQMELFADPVLPVYPQLINQNAILPADLSEQIGRDARGSAGVNARLIEELLIKADSYRDMPVIRVVQQNIDGSTNIREIHLPPDNMNTAQVAIVDLLPAEAVLNIGVWIEIVAPPNSSFQVQGRASASLSECLLCIMRYMSQLQKEGKLCIS